MISQKQTPHPISTTIRRPTASPPPKAQFFKYITSPLRLSLVNFRFFILILAFLFLPVWAERVCSVHDGDTFKLCNGERIRLWGVNAPELGRPWAKESTAYLTRLISGKNVALAPVGKSYDRTVCRVTVGGVDVSRAMVANGYAKDVPKYSHRAYAETQKNARQLKRGMWRP